MSTNSSLTRRDFLKTAATGAAGLAALSLAGRAPAAPAQPKKRPNILVITTDQQRVDVMSVVGCKYLKTPNMDALAANGVYFKKSYTPYPLCSPARTSLHTGRTPHESKVDRNTLPIDPALPLSGNVFRDAGYDTAYSGKWHMPLVYPGGDAIAGFTSLNQGDRTGLLAHDVDENTMNQAIEFMKRKRDQPFYLVVSFINPHDICLLASEDSPILGDVLARYMPKEGAEIPPLPENHEMPAGAPEAFANRRMHPTWDENHWRRYRYAYYRMVEDVDQQVGKVLETLREIGEEENTLIVFTSDHGEGLGCHKWTGKMMYFEDEAAVPLVFAWKGVTPAGRIDDEHLVTALDVLPTICDYAGLQPPAKMRGASLRPVIEKPETPGHEYVASEMVGGPGAGKGRNFMIRTQQYKYMFFPGEAAPVELFFDLDADPLEMKNLGAEAAAAGELDRHRKLLAQWRELTEEGAFPIVPGTTGGRRKKAKAKQAAPAATTGAKGKGGKGKGKGKKAAA